ncbi:MAG: LodA/GoxA family CTQ-dependent oxidase [Xanthobacteraceae bacterium]
MSEEIAYCKIFPPIGIARVGNSLERDGFFIGPEGITLPGLAHERRFTDAAGAVLRQAARFRIYAFDANDVVIGELTAQEAELTWSVSLANKKPEWFEFNGGAEALAQFETPEQDSWDRRNASIKGAERKRRLIIGLDAPITIAGKSTCSSPAAEYAFVGKFQDAKDVYLGELRADEEGRLLVLGGRGHSAAVDETGAEVSGKKWITNYANNDLWHDDTSDGPIECKVKLGGRDIPVKGRAWVLVTPPDFAPDIGSVVTLYDVMEDVALSHGLAHPGLPAPIGADDVEFWRDIYPILFRASAISWVSDLSLRGHARGKAGDFTDERTLALLSDPHHESGRLSREAIFKRIRKPRELASEEEQAAQANGYYMPALSGNEGDATTGDPTTWLLVTALQYKRLEAWAQHRFKPGSRHTAVRSDPAHQPGILTRTALDACTGGPFYPGIEMTAIAHSPRAYSEAYGLADHLEAGDVTKFMAVPWQADFFECNTHWWPAQRPDSVITDRSAEELQKSFPYEGTHGELNRLMLVRQPWARGVEFRRPDTASVEAFLFPPPEEADTQPDHIDTLCDKLRTIFAELVDAVVPGDRTPAERLPSLDRIQFVVQEQFDRFGGRYFHFVVPSPDEFRRSASQTEHAPRKPANEKPAKGRRAAARRGQKADAMPSRRADADYADFIKNRCTDYCRTILETISVAGEPAAQYHGRISLLSNAVGGFTSGVGDYESAVREDFDTNSSHYHNLRMIELGQCAGDIVYLDWSNCSGDNGMVKHWSDLGFVVRRTFVSSDQPDAKSSEAYVETERNGLEGLEYRDFYYMLCNIDQFPEMYEFSSKIVNQFLGVARRAIEHQTYTDSGAVILEKYFDYDKNTFEAKLEEIYDFYRDQAARMKPWELDEARADIVNDRVHSGPYNQNDGAWLRFIANTGTLDDVRGFLFDVWSDEFGNGNPALHHGNLFTTFLRGLNITLPGVATRAYADHPKFNDADFCSPVFQMAISQNSDRYFPEIIGMTLFLEWEVLELAQTIKKLDYHGIDSQFWRMHVGIDNAVDGHGAKARNAVNVYLDNVLKESGRAAMQREWKRIWTGFVAFATAGMNYLGIDGVVARRRPPSMTDKIKSLMARKQHYGSLNHANRKMGANRINDWFDDPDGFVDELAHSAFVVPGNPQASRLLNYLTTFDGPMYEVFDADDVCLWRSWILWLGRTGDTEVVKQYQTKAESMLLLLRELRSSVVGTEGHFRYKLEGKPLHEWFAGDLVELMRALGSPGNPWVVPWNAENSPLVRDFAAGGNRMAQALDTRFPALGNQAGRLVIVRWINAGCPMPHETAPVSRIRSEPLAPRRRVRSLVQEFGIGYVH